MSKFITFLSFFALVLSLAQAFAPVRTHHVGVSPLMAVKSVGSDTDFDTVLKDAGDKLVVVDYSTTWCGPCKVIAPKYEELSEKYSDAIFLAVVGDASADASKLMKREGVRSVPSFHFWVKNEKVDVVNGANPEAIEAAITKAMASV
eukprot:CAMPEP_0198136544 /NCGR_PEP_ID=MMETSP1443-20131203/182_1 /TAXON_ID=186043 /ORGANISM="Entomoneis sp., Strain CCMP2396" /LENGTH=146 /DNA_ID=CAMNT_0043797779 /DNA_START=105 /DNA_END=545 /DNA_ORIENTATION=-